MLLRARRLVAEVLGADDAGNAGWILPIEPLLNVSAAPEQWTMALARVRGRAL